MFNKTLGLVTEQDCIELATGLALYGNQLMDTAAGASHVVLPAAKPMVSMLRRPVRISHIIKTCTLTEDEIASVIMFLNDIGGLIVHRSLWPHCIHSIRKIIFRLRGISLPVQSRRYKSSVWNVVRATSQSCKLLVWATAVMAGVTTFGGVGGWVFVEAHVLLLVTVWISTIVHEAIHMFIAKRSKKSVAVISRGVRIGILHPPLSTVDEVTSALLGPLGGVAAVIVVSLMCTSRDTFVAASVAAVAVFHVASWLPEYGDGKTVRKIWRQYHEK